MSSQRPLRLAQVSDTHLSQSHAYFNRNYDVFAALMQASPPDLIIHSGDASFNATQAPGDLVFARACLERLPSPWRIIPGNHDTGDAAGPKAKDPSTPALQAQWCAQFGAPWWLQDFGAWRLIGIDTALPGSGLDEEAQQAVFFADALATRASRPVMVFAHVPPFTHDPQDATPSKKQLGLAERTAFLDACAAGGVRVIACGHLHIYRALQHRGMDIVWAPATAFVHMPSKVNAQTIMPRAGFIEWQFQGERVRHRLVEPPEMITQDVQRWSEARGSVILLPPTSAPA